MSKCKCVRVTVYREISPTVLFSPLSHLLLAGVFMTGRIPRSQTIYLLTQLCLIECKTGRNCLQSVEGRTFHGAKKTITVYSIKFAPSNLMNKIKYICVNLKKIKYILPFTTEYSHSRSGILMKI